MRQVKDNLLDFLNTEPDRTGGASVWCSCAPSGIKTEGTDAVIDIPFEKIRVPGEDDPARETGGKTLPLRIRAYGRHVIRLSAGFDAQGMPDSPMLELSEHLPVMPLQFEATGTEWLVRDEDHHTRALISFHEPPADRWSDLVPAPGKSYEISFFPGGAHAVQINSSDQFTPAILDALPVAFIERQGVTCHSMISFRAAHDEKFAGTGERFAKMDLSGKTVRLINQDARGVNNRGAYKNIPFYLSSRMYGMFLHTSAPSRFSFTDHSTRSVLVLAQQPLLDIFLLGGSTIEEIVYHYRQVTGFPGLPPLWSFGTWMSRMTYFSAAEVKEVCDRMRKEDLPCDVIHIDTGWFRTDWLCEWKFNPERFPDPGTFIAGLRKDGFRLSLWQLPYIAEEAEQYREAAEGHYAGFSAVRKPREGPDFSVDDYAGTIDFTRPEAVNWYKGILGGLLKMGVSCIKTDFGETIHMDAEYHGMEPEKLQNLYALLYQKAAWDVTREVTGEGIIWARAGWAGCQRYPVHWGGDAACTWDGMAGSLRGGLHLGLSGFGFWSHDVPGFHSIPDFMNTVVPDDLYVRWTQFGVFTSHLRYHGTSKREPYHYPRITSIIRWWLRLRYALIPYIMKESEKAAGTGMPVLRALIFHHAGDPACWHIDDQYYFGDEFLVAPVMNPDNKRDVYLPEGQWVNLFDGKIESGRTWLKNYEVPLEQMPVWARYGSVVPFYPEKVGCTDEMDLSGTIGILFDESFRGLARSGIAMLFSE
jgi:alpha-D-xyloside xylohydrolase